MAKKKKTQTTELQLPPIIPGTEEELTRAIVLLGNRASGKLHQKGQQKLIDLVGEYPDGRTAQQWKIALKQMVKKLANQPQKVESLDPKQEPFPKQKKSEFPSSECNAETQIILHWVQEKLGDYYLDDEECYDPDFISQLKSWYALCPKKSKLVALAKNFLEMSLASEQEENPLDFDLTNYDFDLERSPLAPDASSFVEPLVRLALVKVNWEIIAEYLLLSVGLVEKPSDLLLQ